MAISVIGGSTSTSSVVSAPTATAPVGFGTVASGYASQGYYSFTANPGGYILTSNAAGDCNLVSGSAVIGASEAVSNSSTYTFTKRTIASQSSAGVYSKWAIVSTANKGTGMSYANGYLFSYGNGGSGIYRSTDGTTWTAGTGLTSYTAIRAVAYGNSTYVAMGNNGSTGYIYTSTDGLAWTQRTNQTTAGIVDLVYGAGLFVAVNSVVNSTLVFTSPDGITWTGRSAASGMAMSIAFDGTTFVVVTTTGRVHTSTDGITWASTASGATALNAIAYGGGKFAAIDGNGAVWTSANGTTGWANSGTTGATNMYQIVYGGGQWVITGSTANNIFTSPDAVTWTMRGSQDMNAIGNAGRFIAWNGSKFYFGGAAGIRSSADGIIGAPFAFALFSTAMPTLN